MIVQDFDLRTRRNTALLLSDYTQLPDCNLSDSKKTEWRTYRQALRDLPSDSSAIFEEGRMVEVDWPKEPE